jgi:LysR family transcriptional regulator for bpeEF and oprC
MVKQEADLNKLKVFKEVVLAGSFSKAAINLKQPKSRISRTISSLEQELGLQLIYRTTRQFRLTQGGKELFDKISPLLIELKNTIEQITTENDEVSGDIRITAPEDLGSELLGKLCHSFLQIYPKVRIGIEANNSVVDLVKESIDVAIRIGKVKDSSLIQKKIGKVEMILVTSSEVYLKYHPHQLDDISKIPFLAFKSKSLRSYSLKVANAKETRTIKMTPYFESNNFFVLRSMLLLHSGLALMPSFLVKDHIAKGELIQVCKEWKAEGVPVQILFPQQKEVPERIRKFVDYISPRLMQYF